MVHIKLPDRFGLLSFILCLTGIETRKDRKEMKKLLITNHEVVTQSYILYPTLLFAFAVTFRDGMISFVWPFVFIYSVERVMPFILDGRLNLAEWSGITKFSSLVALVGGILATIGIALHLEWPASIGAIGIGFGVTALKLLFDPQDGLPKT